MIYKPFAPASLVPDKIPFVPKSASMPPLPNTKPDLQKKAQCSHSNKDNVSIKEP